MDFRENIVRINELNINEIRVSRPSIEFFSRRFVKLVIDSDRDFWKPDIWVYTGVDKDYVVLPRLYCSCTSFAVEVISGRKSYCKHLVYQLISETSGNYRVLYVDYETLYSVLKEIMDLNISTSLRRILYRGG
ncbi:MAG: hypothetical protein QXT88_03895 [Desulfurococcaceae archaeon]|uniref:SWIM-type domain-containing protein n=1 Tax=Staphylothermus marinus TaxID=2280 RepID=A0A7C4NL30_STAMA